VGQKPPRQLPEISVSEGEGFAAKLQVAIRDANGHHWPVEEPQKEDLVPESRVVTAPLRGTLSAPLEDTPAASASMEEPGSQAGVGEEAEEEEEEVLAPTPAVSIKRGKVVFKKLHDVEDPRAIPVHWKRQATRLYRVDEPIRLFDFVLGHHGFRQTKRDPNWSLWWTRGGCIRASMLSGLEPWQKVRVWCRFAVLSSVLSARQKATKAG